MYLFSTTAARSKKRNRTARFRAKLKAKNRRRLNRMAGKKQGTRFHKR
jgi:hypothetical protein